MRGRGSDTHVTRPLAARKEEAFVTRNRPCSQGRAFYGADCWPPSSPHYTCLLLLLLKCDYHHPEILISTRENPLILFWEPISGYFPGAPLRELASGPIILTATDVLFALRIPPPHATHVMAYPKSVIGPLFTEHT